MHNIFQVAPVPGHPVKVVSCSADGSLRMTDLETEVESLLGTASRMIHGFCYWGGKEECSDDDALLLLLHRLMVI